MSLSKHRPTAVDIGGLRISLMPPERLASLAAQRQAAGLMEPQIIYAAHITTVNNYANPQFRAAFNAGSAAYADGISVVLMARIMHGVRIKKMATTDFGPLFIDRLSAQLDRPVRIAIIGGVDGVAAAAGQSLERTNRVETVFASHGYHDRWIDIQPELSAARPDLVLIGLGMPLEAQWISAHRALLPPATVVTCGGWLRLLAGLESRAPVVMQRLNSEWLYRLAKDPRRTWARYSQGVVTVARLISQHRSARRQISR